MKKKTLCLMYILSLSFYSGLSWAQTIEEEFAVAEKRYWAGSDLYQQRQLYRIFKDLSERGHACAHRLLASYYVTGNIPSQNYDKAFSLASKAYAMGCKSASATLASYYERGTGVKIDLQKSFDYYVEAAEDDDSGAAAYKVFKIYLRGNTAVSRNLIKAHEWLVYGANHGYDIAVKELEVCNYNGFFCESHLNIIRELSLYK